MITINCPNIKQVIVKTLLLQLRNKINRHYYILHYDVRSWHSKQQYYSYCIINPRLMVFKAIGTSCIMVKAIPERSNEVFYNNLSELSGSYFRITLS